MNWGKIIGTIVTMGILPLVEKLFAKKSQAEPEPYAGPTVDDQLDMSLRAQVDKLRRQRIARLRGDDN